MKFAVRFVGGFVLVVLVLTAGDVLLNQTGPLTEFGYYQNQEGAVKCPGVEPGNTFELNGKTYTAANNTNDDKLISNDKRICTTHVTSMTGGLNDPYVDTSYGNISSISNWDTSRVRFMYAMFSGAQEFNQDISSWCVRRISGKPDLFDYGAGFEGQDSLQPNWGAETECVPEPGETDVYNTPTISAR